MADDDGYRGASCGIRAAVLIGLLIALCVPLGSCFFIFLIAGG